MRWQAVAKVGQPLEHGVVGQHGVASKSFLRMCMKGSGIKPWVEAECSAAVRLTCQLLLANPRSARLNLEVTPGNVESE